VPGKKRLILAGLATFAIGVALSFPARIAYDWFFSPEMRLSGINGTVWKGRAVEVSIGGIYLRDVEWAFLPLSVFKGRVAYAIELQTAFGSLHGNVSAGAGGDIALQNVESSFALREFSDLFQLKGFDGILEMRIDTLVIDDGLPVTARGSIRLSDLLARQISPLVIGDYLAEFSSNESGIIGSVEDLSGVLDVAGTISIRRDRSYSFVGKVAALPEAPAGLADQLQYLGSPDDRGYRDFRIEGQL
jgi:general secretion pathway protein N